MVFSRRGDDRAYPVTPDSHAVGDETERRLAGPANGEVTARPPSEARRGALRSILLLLPVVLLWALLHSHALRLGFVGDDYQWWQWARRAVASPFLLFAPYGGYRPVNTWTLAFDYLLWGTNPLGYHLTNLLLHLGCGIALWGLLVRERLSAIACATVAALWLCSPFSDETATFIAARFEPIMLMLWLGLALVWPRPDEAWTPKRAAAALTMAGLTVLTKESWVVLPGFVLAFDLFLSRASLRRALVRAGCAAVAVAVYLVIYFAHPAIAPAGFFAAGVSGALKVPHAWAAFLGLCDVRPVAFPFGFAEACALVTMVLLAVLAWRRAWRLVAIGFAFFLLPFLPILPVGWMTSRYTTIPLAGFLIVLAASLRGAISGLRPTWRRGALLGVGTVVLLLLGTNLAWLRGDRIDARRYWDLSRGLLGEATIFLAQLPLDRPLVVIRLEKVNPLIDLVLSSQGTIKIYYARHADPYDLTDWSALFSYVLDARGGPLFLDVDDPQALSGAYAVIAHVEGGFVRLEPRATSVAAEVDAWRRQGTVVKVLRPIRL